MLYFRTAELSLRKIVRRNGINGVYRLRESIFNPLSFLASHFVLRKRAVKDRHALITSKGSTKYSVRQVQKVKHASKATLRHSERSTEWMNCMMWDMRRAYDDRRRSFFNK